MNGSIPMCMGPPPVQPLLSKQDWVYPHVYGATSSSSPKIPLTLGLSPCVWGHQRDRQVGGNISGSIPMCMGPPETSRMVRKYRRVYRHVYGATGDGERGED